MIHCYINLDYSSILLTKTKIFIYRNCIIFKTFKPKTETEVAHYRYLKNLPKENNNVLLFPTHLTNRRPILEPGDARHRDTRGFTQQGHVGAQGVVQGFPEGALEHRRN